MNKLVLGYDTIGGHIPLGHRYKYHVEKLFENGMFIKSKQKSSDSSVTSCLIKEDGYKLNISLRNHIQISVECSLPKVLYGNNFYLVGPDQAKKAIEKVSKIIGLDFSLFSLNRLDTTVSLSLPFDYEEISKVIRSPKYHNRFGHYEEGVYYGTGRAKSKQRNRVLSYYNKWNKEAESGILRIESRVYTASKLEKYLLYDPYVYSVLKEGFFLNSTNYLKDRVYESTRKNCTSPYAQAIITSLEEAYTSVFVASELE